MLLSLDSMVNSKTSPLGTPSFAAISGAGLWVGPMMKFPSSFAEGMAPSGNSFALTYPGVLGSRVGSGGRAPLLAFAGAGLSGGCCAGGWAIAGPTPAIRQIKNALVGTPGMHPFIDLKLHILRNTARLLRPRWGFRARLRP